MADDHGLPQRAAMRSGRRAPRKQPSTKKVGIYRRALTSREIEIFESVARDALIAYGYRPEHASPRPVTRIERGRSLLADRVIRWYRKLRYPAAALQEIQVRMRAARRRLRSSGPLP